ncbi:hypothetical protein FCV25MIE_00254, partial [Fagus crenata]
MKGILDSSGTWCVEEGRMGEVAAVQYVEAMFSTSSGLEWEDTIRAIDRVVTSDMNCLLTAPFTALE